MTAVRIDECGNVVALYGDEISEILGVVGEVRIKRASHVEPRGAKWFAEIVDGPVLGPFDKRAEAIEAEIDWLRKSGRVD